MKFAMKYLEIQCHMRENTQGYHMLYSLHQIYPFKPLSYTPCLVVLFLFYHCYPLNPI